VTGQIISHYRILEKLGEGGMGLVYKAEDQKLKRTVALKFLPRDDPEMKERFLQEAQAAAALHHPNICTVFEIDEDNGFLAMEFVEGVTLKAKIAERPLPLEEAFGIAAQMSAALQEAHEKNVTHRDIKPGNVMISSQGVVKIMDFGLARIGDGMRITKTGSARGTPSRICAWTCGCATSNRRARRCPNPGWHGSRQPWPAPLALLPAYGWYDRGISGRTRSKARDTRA
jgi:serine/threonine protein kinase